MQEIRDEWNEKRIDKLEERINILEAGVSNEWDHNTTTFKAILEALETIQKITENLDQRVQRLENTLENLDVRLDGIDNVVFSDEEDS